MFGLLWVGGDCFLYLIFLGYVSLGGYWVSVEEGSELMPGLVAIVWEMCVIGLREENGRVDCVPGYRYVTGSFGGC